MKRTQKGFTLVEIMIVVVIIGLLAAMAIPAFQKVRQSSIQKTLINDAKQMAGAANQYMMEYGVSSITATYADDGKVGGDLSVYVKYISKGNLLPKTWYASLESYVVTNSALGANSTVGITAEGQKL
jgi:type IV pilus assembly protein PilA